MQRTLEDDVKFLLEIGFEAHELPKLFALNQREHINTTIRWLLKRERFANPISFDRFLKYLQKDQPKDALELISGYVDKLAIINGD